MSHAGDVVLFGGSVEAGESPSDAALRELCEESNTDDHLTDPEYRIGDHLGRWITESGITVDGFFATLPATFYDEARPDTREVDRLVYLGLDELTHRAPEPQYHRVDERDIQFETRRPVQFESPTVTLFEASTGEPWTLWGAAGFMASRAHRMLRQQP
ncbi:NUDIX domain-containing protein [Williamsia sp.]|uniref:NUDIX domain-containing protein n=1 Tax=Williamsia sp. TaxID=1872085 RepID=UPI001A1854DE|nr:NUDIX domain-containing protein [Williamsia sp.]MBJ7291806.1 NUDIX domain-containing protein [Williamsia sp.]